MRLSLILDGQYYSFVILLFVGSHRKFLHNSGYPQTFVANSIVVIPFGIFSQLRNVLLSDCYGVLAIEELPENFELLSLFFFPFSIGASHSPIQNVEP